MKELILIEKLIANAYQITQSTLEKVISGDYADLDSDIESRGKILDIIAVVQERLNVTPIPQNSCETFSKFNNELNQLINFLIEIDQEILIRLEEEKTKTQNEIAKTFKNKENFKGYNLNSLK